MLSLLIKHHKTTRLGDGQYEYRGCLIKKTPGQFKLWRTQYTRTGFTADTLRACKKWIDDKTFNAKVEYAARLKKG